MEMKAKRSYWLRLINSCILVIFLIDPSSAALAHNMKDSASAQNTITASAVIVPAQVAELGFLVSAMARDIPVKEGDTVQAGQTLVILDTPELQYAVTEAEAALRSAQSYADLQKYKKVQDRRNGKVFWDTVPTVYRERADAKVQQAQVALEIAQLNLTQGTLTAPFDGTVASIRVVPGEFVASDQVIVTLATFDTFQIETTDLSERAITKIRMGAPVNTFIEALHADFTGTVTDISPIADTGSGDVVFKVTIAFDEQPENILWGMTAEVHIEE